MNRIASTAAATIIGGFALLALTACQAAMDGSGVAVQASVTISQTGWSDGQTAAPTSDASRPTAGTRDSSTATGGTTDPSSVTEGPTDPSSVTGGTTAATPTTGGTTATTTSAPSTSAASTVTLNTTEAAAAATAMYETVAPRPTLGRPFQGSGAEVTAVAPPAAVGNGSLGMGDAHTGWPGAPSIVSASISCEVSSSDQNYHGYLSYEVAHASGMALSIDNPGIVGSSGTYGGKGTIEIPNEGCYRESGPHTYSLSTVGGMGPHAWTTITRTGTHPSIVRPKPHAPASSSNPAPAPTAPSAPTGPAGFPAGS